jgi:hypothetical protein
MDVINWTVEFLLSDYEYKIIISGFPFGLLSKSVQNSFEAKWDTRLKHYVLDIVLDRRVWFLPRETLEQR